MRPVIQINDEQVPKREGRCVVPIPFEEMLQKRFDKEVSSGSRLMEYEQALYVEWLQCYIYRLYMYIEGLEGKVDK
jgi:hypothetical protein